MVADFARFGLPEWLTTGDPIAVGNRAKSGVARQPLGSKFTRSLSRENVAGISREATYHVCRAICRCDSRSLDKGQNSLGLGCALRRVTKEFPKINVYRCGNSEQCVYGGQAFLLFDTHHHRVIEAGSRCNLIERKPLSASFCFECSNKACDNFFALAVGFF